MLISGLIRTALTDTNTPGMALVCNRKISLSSFCNKRAILFCLVVSINFLRNYFIKQAISTCYNRTQN